MATSTAEGQIVVWDIRDELQVYIFCVCILMLCTQVNIMFWCYSECVSTLGRLKSLPDHGGNRTHDLWDTLCCTCLQCRASLCCNNVIILRFLTIQLTANLEAWKIWCNISSPTIRTGLYFKSAQFDQVLGEAKDWIKMRGREYLTWSKCEDVNMRGHDTSYE
jgi:hypothetical protein